MGELVRDDVINCILLKYDMCGELSPIQVQMLHSDMRIGGLSLPQVHRAMEYVCVNQSACEPSELIDLLKEMDRRYFLLKDFSWEFSLLDRERTDSLTVEQSRWFVQAAHGKNFSKRKWDKFIQNRPIWSASVFFHEIEVLLCDIWSREGVEQEHLEEEKLKQENIKNQRDLDEEVKKELEIIKTKKEQEKIKRAKEREQEEKEKLKNRLENEEKRKREEYVKKLAEEEAEREERRLKIMPEENQAEAEIRRIEEYEIQQGDVEQMKKDLEEEEDELEKKLEELRRSKLNVKEDALSEIEVEIETKTKEKKEVKQKKLKYGLKVAIRKRDKFELEYSIKEFKKEIPKEGDMDLDKAEKLLKEILSKDKLRGAISKREIEQIEKAIQFIKKHGLETKLASEVIDANKLLSKLHRLEKIRHEILELKQSTVAEIRSYQNPPTVVHTVMISTLLLLGHTEKETKDWKAVQALVGKTGKQSLKRRCVEFNAEKITMAIGQKARSLLSKYRLEEVRDVSAGAATFYVWATAMIEEAMDRLENQ